MSNEILHQGIRAFLFVMKGADGTEVTCTFDRYAMPNFIYTSREQMTSNAIASIMKAKGADWATANFKLIPVADPHA